MVKKIGIHTGDFEIEYTPGKLDKNGHPTSKEVSLVFKNYKGWDKKKFDMNVENYNSLMDCENTTGFEVKCKGGLCGSVKNPAPDVPCSGKCKVIASGTYSAGGLTDSNPVVITFDSGEKVKFNQAFVNLNLETCTPSDLTKFKI